MTTLARRTPLTRFVFKVTVGLGVSLCAMTLYAAQTITGYVTETLDGDTFRLKEPDGTIIKIRLFAADCPEIAHPGLPAQPFGQEALAFTKARAECSTVTVQVHGKSYDRIVGEVWVKGETESLNRQLVLKGLAWVDARYTGVRAGREWKAIEGKARAAKAGLWAKPATAPWLWRAQHKRKAA